MTVSGGGSQRVQSGPTPGGSALSPLRLVFAFATVFLVIVIAAIVAIFILAPQTPPPECQPGQPCGGPPVTPPPITGEATAGTFPSSLTTAGVEASPGAPAPEATPGASGGPLATILPGLPQPIQGDPASPPLRAWPAYTDTTLGYSLFYPPFLSPEETADGGVVFGAGISALDVEVAIRFDVATASTTPDQLRDELVDRYRGRLSSLAIDDTPLLRIHRPTIGDVPGIAESYRGDLGVSGSITPVALVVVTATDGRLTTGLTVVVFNPDTVLPGSPLRWFRAAGDVIDPMLKRFEWSISQ